jgi:hypothetical protein
MNLTKDVKDLYNENCSALKKEKALENGKTTMLMDCKSIIILKMLILSIVVYKLNAILIKYPLILFTGIEKLILESTWKHERAEIAKAILSK